MALEAMVVEGASLMAVVVGAMVRREEARDVKAEGCSCRGWSWTAGGCW